MTTDKPLDQMTKEDALPVLKRQFQLLVNILVSGGFKDDPEKDRQLSVYCKALELCVNEWSGNPNYAWEDTFGALKMPTAEA